MLDKKIIYIAIVIYFITAYFSVGQNSPDEYYQILELAAYKLNLSSHYILTWEFDYQIRPALQIWFAVMIYKLGNLIGTINPFVIAFFLRLVSAFLSLCGVWLFIKAFTPSIKHNQSKKWFILLSLFTWVIVYNSVRYSSENIAEKFFLIGFSLLFLPSWNKKIFIQVLIGILFGFAFITRFQMILAIIPTILWLLFCNNFKFISTTNQKVINKCFYIYLTLGFGIAYGCGVITDKWFYGKWVISSWNYLYMNIFMGKAASFGVEPWYFYTIVIAIIPYGLFYILSTIVAIYPTYKKFSNPTVWVVGSFLLGHLIVSHKELRFLVPILCFMPLLISYSIDILIDSNWFTNPKVQKIWQLSWFLNCFIVFCVAILPSGVNVYLCKFIYDKYTAPAIFYSTSEGGNLLNFYKRSNMTIRYVKNVNDMQCNTSQIKNQVCLFAIQCKELPLVEKLTVKSNLVYDNCPNWITYINFNDWISRTGLFRIYETHS